MRKLVEQAGPLVTEDYVVRELEISKSTIKSWVSAKKLCREFRKRGEQQLFHLTDVQAIKYIRENPGLYVQAIKRMMELEGRVERLEKTVKILAAATGNQGLAFTPSDELLCAMHSVAINYQGKYVGCAPDEEFSSAWASVVHWLSVADLSRLNRLRPKEKMPCRRLFMFTDELALSTKAVKNLQFSTRAQLTCHLLNAGLDALGNAMRALYLCTDDAREPDTELSDLLNRKFPQTEEELREASLIKEQHEKLFPTPEDSSRYLINLARESAEMSGRPH